MGYHVIDPEEIEPAPDRPSEMHYVSEAAGMQEMGLRLYRVEPGEEIPLSGLHYHEQQEEAFYVVSGRLTVETPETEYTVEQGQFFIAEPESAHRTFNHDSNNETTVVVGMGAPPISDGHPYEK
ncbi:cupin domain-containing protein [Halomicroarcula sp. F28]|uniref:cupin domain-containing protein n=1 Tax=Haloarcula salinisoli TaxID=2487746 RepID=UPI001C72C1DB|nr:cupin domain-containing protein [Halomicroarcula salinisoli]MBX0287003.1 cupin domain-containing protein [Halomicroarcula salinisoli]